MAQQQGLDMNYFVQRCSILLLVIMSACSDSGPGSPSSARVSEDADNPINRPALFGIGHTAPDSLIAAWDIDILPDGHGLPPGSGTVAEGEQIFAAKCQVCHGRTGVEGPFDRLVETDAGKDFDFGRTPGMPRTIGNYWPYATTLYDYINRAMPQTEPGSLEADEVYSLVAFLFYRNEIIPVDAIMNAESLPQVVMPAHDRFVRDNRTDGSEVR